EHLAIIAVGPRLLLRFLPLAHHLRRVGEHLRIDVAQRHDFNRPDLNEAEQVALAVPATADEPDALVHPRGRFVRERPTRSDSDSGGAGGAKEMTAIHCWYLVMTCLRASSYPNLMPAARVYFLSVEDAVPFRSDLPGLSHLGSTTHRLLLMFR